MMNADYMDYKELSVYLLLTGNLLVKKPSK